MSPRTTQSQNNTKPTCQQKRHLYQNEDSDGVSSITLLYLWSLVIRKLVPELQTLKAHFTYQMAASRGDATCAASHFPLNQEGDTETSSAQDAAEEPKVFTTVLPAKIAEMPLPHLFLFQSPR